MKRSTRSSTKPSLMSRLTGGKRGTTTTKTTTVEQTTSNRVAREPRRTHKTAATRTAPATHHHRRKPTVGDKVSGSMLKLRGTLTRRPGMKAAGTRREHGTDGRGSHRTYY